MKITIIIMILFFQSLIAKAENDPFAFLDDVPLGSYNYIQKYQCILKEMPGARTNSKARNILSFCKINGEKYYDKDYKNNWFSPKTSLECIRKYSDDTNSDMADKFIGVSCRKLY